MPNEIYATVSFRLPLSVYEKFCRIVRLKSTNKAALAQEVITEFTAAPQRAPRKPAAK